ncbi:MAG: hypothetical protein PQ612_09615 [Rickettsiales bacterium]|nr:hypothetical protein [Pseudomonadota bacterium]MDA0966051.1 hypothetical protein [Pseudomonadota bacterium]MDG4544233.1 hypothetical protein [Rickettsiales bacterium]MDG4546412.1 hypothetical protein [Rickettsiales bacterium]MDG4548557.1 hypothetical protein [Rickettsiales bacterium]
MFRYFKDHKYFLIFWLGGWFLLGSFFAVLTGFFGIIIDRLLRPLKNPTNQPFTTSLIWFGIIFPFSFLYVFIIVIFTSETSDYNLIHAWINSSKPLTDKMAEYIPVIDNITRQILDRGDSWRVDRVRHLYGVLWFICIITSPLLFKDSCRFAKYITQRYYRTKNDEKFRRLVIMYLNFFLFGMISFLSIWSLFAGYNDSIDISNDSYRRLERFIAINPLGVFLFLFLSVPMMIALVRIHYRKIKPLIKKV